MSEIELIQNYLAGKLPVSEKTAFHKRLAEEPLLQEKLAEYKTIMEGFRGLRTEAFENEIKTWDQKDRSDQSIGITNTVEQAKPTAKIFSLRNIAAAASILLLVGFGTWFFSSGDTMQDILNQNKKFLAFSVKENASRGDNTLNEFLVKVQEAHQYNTNKEYKKTATALDQLLTQSSTPEDYRDELYWRKIVCLLNQFALDQQESSKTTLIKAIEQFLPIANKDDIYKANAENLLSNLK